MNKIIVVDDEKDIRLLVSGILEDENFEVVKAKNSQSFFEKIEAFIPDLIILDVWLNESEYDGVEILDLIQKTHPHIPVIMMSGHGTVDIAVSAIKKGAYDFILKPFKAELLINKINRALSHNQLIIEQKNNLNLTDIQIDELSTYYENLPKFDKKIKKLSKQNMALITGDSGTGKSYLAEYLFKIGDKQKIYNIFDFKQHLDKNYDELFCLIFGCKSCAGLVEIMNGGYLVFKNFQLCPKNIQDNLSKFIYHFELYSHIFECERYMNMKIIFIADSKDSLTEEFVLRTGERLIEMPNLNNLKHCFEDICKSLYNLRIVANGFDIEDKIISYDLIIKLQSIEYKDSLKELISIIDFSILNSDKIIDAQIIENMITSNQKNLLMSELFSLSMKDAKKIFETEYLKFNLQSCNNNITKLAKETGMDRAALHRKINNLGIDREK